ncbi:MAG: protein kinase [Deltaproteobacteria bacterium]|nr:protein kinase [Deltaproteobacteria bacterium]
MNKPAGSQTQLLDPVSLPASIGGYAVLRRLGEGGMGTVYECHDQGLDRHVALKVLKVELANDETMKSRFLREARAMAKVSSPHVVTVYAVGEDAGAPFIVMEKLEGEDLSERLRGRGALAPDEVLAILKDSVAGLDAAAQRGLVHRDVKPANLFLVVGRTKVTDFGLARPIDGSASVTQAGLIVGTPYYMAPELGRGGAASVSSDIYALGITAFELLTGQPPFNGSTPVTAMAAHIVEPVPRVVDVCPRAGAALGAVIERMLAKSPAERFASWADVDVALRALAVPLEMASAPAATPAPSAQVVPTTSPGMPVAAPVSSSGPSSSGVFGGASVKTETLTVMFTDIAGYTLRTGQQSRNEAARWLALHDGLLLPVVRAFRGTLVKTIGDALLVTFRSPTDAVLCGMAIQDRLFQHNQVASEADRIEVRVAISAGEVRMQRGDIFGEPVNLAARLEGLGERGEVLFTDAVHATMNTAEVPVSPRGTHTFKGISRSVAVFAALPSTTPGALPFGGYALARVGNGGFVERARGQASTLATTASGHVSRIVGLAGPRGEELLAAVGRIPPRLGLGAAVVVVVVALVAVLASGDSEADLLMRALEEENASAARSKLSALAAKDGGVVDDLVDLADSGSWWPRHHALAILEGNNAAEKVDREEFAIKDLEEGDNCGRRRMGLVLLKRVGKSERALEAIEKVAAQKLENACMFFEVGGAQSAIRARMKAP